MSAGGLEARRPAEVPLVAGCVLAARAWTVDRQTGYLRSPVQATVWPPDRPLAARCVLPSRLPRWLRRHHHHLPDMDCRCGVWGLADPKLLARRAPYGPRMVHGVVALWRRVVVGTEGWRGEYARPLALSASPVFVPFWPSAPNALKPRDVEEVAAAYGVPTFEDWPELSDPTGLL